MDNIITEEISGLDLPYIDYYKPKIDFFFSEEEGLEIYGLNGRFPGAAWDEILQEAERQQEDLFDQGNGFYLYWTWYDMPDYADPGWILDSLITFRDTIVITPGQGLTDIDYFRPKIEFLFIEKHIPVEYGINGRFTLDLIEEIEEDVYKRQGELFKQGNGFYLYEMHRGENEDIKSGRRPDLSLLEFEGTGNTPPSEIRKRRKKYRPI